MKLYLTPTNSCTTAIKSYTIAKGHLEDFRFGWDGPLLDKG